MVFGKVSGRFFIGPHLGLEHGDDTPDTATLSELIETFPYWEQIVPRMPSSWKQLYTMFETSDVHPDIIKSMRHFNRVLVPFPYLRDILAGHGIYAVSMDFYTSDIIRENHPIIPKTRDPEKLLFLYIGTNDSRKNLTTLTRAFARLGGQHTLIVKTNKVTGLTLGPTIKVLTERLTNTQLAHLYNLCDYVISATRGEGVGLPMLEANYFGKPVIAHDQGVFRDVKKFITVPWHVIPSTEVPIDYGPVPDYLYKVFWGTWWDVSEDDVLKTIQSIL